MNSSPLINQIIEDHSPSIKSRIKKLNKKLLHKLSFFSLSNEIVFFDAYMPISSQWTLEKLLGQKRSYFHNKYPDCFPIMHSTGFDSYKGTDLVINSLPEIIKSSISSIFLKNKSVNSSSPSNFFGFISNSFIVL